MADPTQAPSHKDEPRVTRDDIIGPASLSFGAGVWLVVSPWMLAYTAADAWWNPIVFGVIIAILALVRLATPDRTTGLSAVNAAIGVWLFVAGFWLPDSARAEWNGWILGVVVFAVAMADLASPAARTSGDGLVS